MREYRKPKTLAEAEEQQEYFRGCAGNLHRWLERVPPEEFDEIFQQWQAAKENVIQANVDVCQFEQEEARGQLRAWVEQQKNKNKNAALSAGADGHATKPDRL